MRMRRFLLRKQQHMPVMRHKPKVPQMFGSFFLRHMQHQKVLGANPYQRNMRMPKKFPPI